MNETLFYVFGIALAVSAVFFSFVGLKSGKFPGKAMPLVALWFIVLAAGSATFAVLHAQDEKEHKAHELEHANEVIEGEEEPQHEVNEEGGAEEESTAPEEEGGEEAGGEAAGAGGKVEVVANETEIAFEETSLEAEAGEVEIDFDNPSAIGHDVRIEGEGEDLGGTEVITQGEESATVELEPGEYTFFCSVPGHREAGMEGPLTVK